MQFFRTDEKTTKLNPGETKSGFIENIEVNDVPELQEQIGKFKPGDEVSLIVRRKKLCTSYIMGSK